MKCERRQLTKAELDSITFQRPVVLKIPRPAKPKDNKKGAT
jgi:hypothetical protein